jgi:FkbM family methyltransferase
LTREIKWREDVTVLPRETFYPYSWNESSRAPRRWTYGTHLWTHSWKHVWNSRPAWREFLTVTKANAIRFALNIRRRTIARTRRFLIKLRRTLRVDRSQPYSVNGVICAQTIHGPKIFLLGDDATITPEIALHGTYEFLEERFIERTIRPGDWAIDVGANVGMLSLLIGQCVGPFGRVFSYEPNPLPSGLLRKSLVMNWLHNRVEVRETALGSETGVRTLRFSRAGLGGATLAAQGAAGTYENVAALLAEEDHVDVNVSTLDADFPADLPIRLLKIDVEGFEHEVLRGASRLLERQCCDILMLECIQEVYGPNWPEYLAELKKIMSSGYGLYTLSGSSKLRPLSFKRLLYGDRLRNIFLVAEHAKGTICELS